MLEGSQSCGGDDSYCDMGEKSAGRRNRDRARIQAKTGCGDAPAVVPIDEEQIRARRSLNLSYIESANAAKRAYDKAYWSAKSDRFIWRSDLLKHLDQEVRLGKHSHVEIARDAGITECVLSSLIEVGLVPVLSNRSELV